MNYGPLEFGAYLQRRETGQDESAEVRAARAAAAEARPEDNGLSIVSGPSELRPLARDAKVEAVSVYEAIVDRAPGHRASPVRVRVQRAWRPIVLVLSSHQPVCWQIEPAEGVDLRAVLLAGSGESRLAGAPQVPVTSIGGFYAFKSGSLEFRHLEREVRRFTGCSIEHFYGAYAEDQFEVGMD
jgi:hypothetical protein